MTSTLLTVDTHRPVEQSPGELGQRQPMYMAIPTPNAYRDIEHRLPSDSAWLARSLAYWVEENAEWIGVGHAKLRATVQRDDGGRLLVEGRDLLTLHGVLQYPFWHDAIDQARPARVDALLEELSQHIAALRFHVRRLVGVSQHEKLPSELGFYAAEEIEDFEVVVLDGAGDCLDINGAGLREPFRSLGYDLTAPVGPYLPTAAWMPLGFNEYLESASGHSRAVADHLERQHNPESLAQTHSLDRAL